MATSKSGSVLKAFDILILLSRSSRPLSSQEISAATHVTLSTTHRYLLTLEDIGAVARRPDKKFHLGMLMSELGQHAAEREIMADRAKVHVERLAESIGEAVRLSAFNQGEIEKIVGHEPIRPLVYRERRSSNLELHNSSIGKLFLSSLPILVCEERLSVLTFVKTTDDTITDVAVLRKELGEIRRNNLAWSHGEMESGLDCVSVPFVGPHGTIMGGLTISAPSSRLRGKSMNGKLVKLRATAKTISDSLFVESHTLPTKSKPRGSFPHVKIVGNLAFVSGTSSRRPDDSFVGAHITSDGKVVLNLSEQTRETLQNISDILNSVGTSMERVVHLETYLTVPEQEDEFYRVARDFFRADPPGCSVIAAKALPHPDQLVMIKAVAQV